MALGDSAFAGGPSPATFPCDAENQFSRYRRAAHDIDNMLAAASIKLDFLRRHRDDFEVASHAADTEDVGLVMSSVIGYCQNVIAQIHDAEPVRPTEPVDVDELLLRQAAIVGLITPEEIRIIVEREEPGGHWVMVGEFDLLEALTELCLNAMKALSTAGGRIDLTVKRIRLDGCASTDLGLAAGRYHRVSVSDNGPGMSAEALERALEPGFTTCPGQSTGRGLAFVHRFGCSHGGNLFINNTSGRGTTVSLLLPEADVSRAVHARL